MKKIARILFIFLLLNLRARAQSPLPKEHIKDSIDKYNSLRKYSLVVPFAKKWVDGFRQETDSADYARRLDTYGEALGRAGKGKEAEPILLTSLRIRKKMLGANHLDVGSSFNSLGRLYYNSGDYPKAEINFLEAVKILKKVHGENHPDVAKLLNNLGSLYILMAYYQKAEECLLGSLEIRKIAFGETHFEVANSVNSLGVLYFNLGDYAKAETYFLQNVEITKKNLGEDHLDVASSLNNLGNLYNYMGNYPKAESCYFRALEIRRKSLNENHPDLAASLNNLGSLYLKMGNFQKAEPFIHQALEIRKNAFGLTHPEVANSLSSCGQLYKSIGNFAKAEAHYLQALEIYRKVLRENHPDISVVLVNLGNLYSNMNCYAKAELQYHQALDISRKSYGENHPDVAYSLNNIGSLYGKMGNFNRAEQCLKEATEIRKKALGENHPQVANSIAELAKLNFYNGRMATAEPYMLDWNAKKLAELKRYFPFMSDQEKEQFFESDLSQAQIDFKSYCIERYPGKKDIAAYLYNNQLATKGLLLNSSAKWKHRIKTAGDKKLNRLFDDWEMSQNKLIKLIQSSDSTKRAGLDSIQAKTEKMEKELSLRSENFAKLADKKQVTWNEVQKALKPGEAAIEMIRIKKLGLEKIVADTSDIKKPIYKVKGLTDTIYYAALIVKPESVYPEIVLLKNGNDLEGRYLNFYQNAMKNQIPDDTSYIQFWEKIEKKLGAYSRIFFSPDGVFHKINLNTLQNPKTKKYLLEEKDIRIVTGTKDILNPSPPEEANYLAELIGFPSYYHSPTTAMATIERKSPKMSYGLQLDSIGTLAELPGTKIEVDKIARVLETRGWEVKTHTGDKAIEENIKESYKPRLLHIATHGFFQTNNTKGTNPLLHSGLMLTGAGNTLKGEKNESGEDGILTAYEAMNLNLDNTDLVVLSACETGLGELKNGEGVYGLQRAFKVAGAKSIIMSLRKVDDEATQELMVAFYKNWLGGTSKRAAFLKAQKELKAKYPNPYFWGAFVMVGE